MDVETQLHDVVSAIERDFGDWVDIDIRSDVVDGRAYSVIVTITPGSSCSDDCDAAIRRAVRGVFGPQMQLDGSDWEVDMAARGNYFYDEDPQLRRRHDAGHSKQVHVTNRDWFAAENNPAGRHISCGDLPPKQCRQLQHVYESAVGRGFSKKRAAQQAWSTVNRATESNPMATSKKNPTRRKVSAPYVVWQHSDNDRWFVSREGYGSAVTSARGYGSPAEAASSAIDMMYKRGEHGKTTIEFEEQEREDNPAASEHTTMTKSKINPRDPKPPRGQFILARTSGMDTIVLSAHKNRAAAESAMRKRGGEPDSLMKNGMDIYDLSKGWELIHVFDKWQLRPAGRRSNPGAPDRATILAARLSQGL